MRIQDLAQYTEEQIENAFQFLQEFKTKSAKDLAGIEHVAGPVFDDPSVTTGTKPEKEDYDVGLAVAERIIAFLKGFDHPLGWEDLDGLVAIRGFGPDKFRDIVYSADKKYGNHNLLRNWVNIYRPFVIQVLTFWNDWIDLRVNRPPTRDSKQLVQDPKAFDRWIWTIRAISWFESRYGLGTGHHPDRDPMQSGNPKDTFWLELHGLKIENEHIVEMTDDGTTVVRGWERKPNSHVRYLLRDIQNYEPKVVGRFSQEVYDFKGYLNNSRDGHNDEKFTYKMSYFWGILHFLTGANGQYDYNCDNSTREHLLGEVSKYGPSNSPDAPHQHEIYVKRITNFLDSRGVFVPPPASQPVP